VLQSGTYDIELEAGDEFLSDHVVHLLGDLVDRQVGQVRERLELGHADGVPHLHALHAAAILHRAQALALGGEQSRALEAGEGPDGGGLGAGHSGRRRSECSRGHSCGGSNNGRHSSKSCGEQQSFKHLRGEIT
jgi:hypothetical protein